jgi:hypothetical protein
MTIFRHLISARTKIILSFLFHSLVGFKKDLALLFYTQLKTNGHKFFHTYSTPQKECFIKIILYVSHKSIYINMFCDVTFCPNPIQIPWKDNIEFKNTFPVVMKQVLLKIHLFIKFLDIQRRLSFLFPFVLLVKLYRKTTLSYLLSQPRFRFPLFRSFLPFFLSNYIRCVFVWGVAGLSES